MKKTKNYNIVCSNDQCMEEHGHNGHQLNGVRKMKKLLTPKKHKFKIVESEVQEGIRTPVKDAQKKPCPFVVVDTETQNEELPSSSPAPAALPKRVLKVTEKESVKAKFVAMKESKRKLKKAVTPRDVTALKRLNETVMNDVVKKCRECQAEKRCCSQLNFSVVRHVRTILYGPEMNRTKRRKTIMSWLTEIYKMSRTKREKENLRTETERVRSYFIFDFSFSQNEKEIEAIPCCKDCFRNVIGVSSATLTQFWKELRGSNMHVETAAAPSTCAQKGFESSPERLACHAWMEFFVATQACLSPDNHKSELAAVTTIKDMHEMFSADWKAGVMSGTNYRKHLGRGKKGRRVPGDNKEKPPVDEEGAFEPSDAVKNKLMAKHPPPSYSFFCKVWKSDFSGDYKIPRHLRRFTQCNWCAELKANLKHTTDSEDRLFYKMCLYDHYKWITEQRHKYYKHRKKAEMHPSK